MLQNKVPVVLYHDLEVFVFCKFITVGFMHASTNSVAQTPIKREAGIILLIFRVILSFSLVINWYIIDIYN